MEKKERIRLDKFLSDAGCGTRSEVKKLIKAGFIRVNGEKAVSAEVKIIPGEDAVTNGSSPVLPPEKYIYYMLHKPAGYITATEDRRERTVMELLPCDRKGLFPVGRLDKDTEGLLLITDDGPLSHALLSPKRHVDKTYFVKPAHPLDETAIRALCEGVDIGDDKKTEKATARLVPDGLLLTIHEGRYHQVKRMLEAVGNEVLYLKRLSMGPLVLPPSLPAGEYRRLTADEIAALKQLET